MNYTEGSLQHLAEAVGQLSPLQRDLLRFLLQFFARVAAPDAPNDVTAFDIGRFFGPVIIRPRVRFGFVTAPSLRAC